MERAVRFPMRLFPPALVFLVACAVSAGTVAAYKSTSTNPGDAIASGSVQLTDNDSGSAMLGLTNAGSGASDTSCIKVTSNGTLASTVRLETAPSGALAQHLGVRVTRGTGAAGFDDCTGFSAASINYYGLGQGVVYDGRLSDMPTDWTTGLSDPSDSDSATSIIPVLSARTNLVGLWELGERTRRADNFSGTTASALETHAELFGTLWAKQAVSTTGAILTGSGRVRPANAGTALYRVATATGIQEASADLIVATAGGEAGVMTQMQTTGDTGYLARYNGATGTFELVLMNAGVATVLGSWVHTVPSGTQTHLELDQNGSALSVSVDGTQRISATDATLAAAARTGVRLVGTGVQDDETGVQLDNFRSSQPAQASTVASVGTTATATAAPVVQAGVQPSPTDQQASVNFNGTTQTLSLPAAGLTTVGTLAGWFRWNSGSAALLRDSSTGATAGWSLGYDDGSGTLHYRCSGQVFDTGVLVAELRGSWHHHALVCNGATAQYYLDGRLVSTGAVTTPTAPTSPFFLMKDGTAAAFSKGNVDQVGIWGRALTAPEIAAIHDSASAPNSWNTGEAHWYKFVVTVDNSAAAASSSATANFTWEARNQ